MLAYLSILFLLLAKFGLCLQDIKVLTVATEHNDAVDRFLRSANLFGYNVKVIGLGVEWRGGDVAKSIGGGQKVNLLKDALEEFKDREDLLVLFVDSYDVVFLQQRDNFLKTYAELGARVVFSAETFCWPDKSLVNYYPMVSGVEKRFLNSGGFVGPASDLYKIVSHTVIKDNDDDQLYYTKIFLDEKMREKYNIKLDTRSELFQNLNGAINEVEIDSSTESGRLYNTFTGTYPAILHGNGPIKHIFNSMTNYLSHAWTPITGCQHCHENNIPLADRSTYPVIVLGIFVDKPVPFVDVFFERIANLTYPKNRIHLIMQVLPSAESESEFVSNYNKTHGFEYLTAEWVSLSSDDDGVKARKATFAKCLSINSCEFVLVITPEVQITAINLIEHLVTANRSSLTPMMARRGKLWSNFWGALSDDGYYSRSDDYISIINRERTGIWNVPFVRDVHMLARRAVKKLMDIPDEPQQDFEMFFARTLRAKNIFMMLDNREEFGYLTVWENRTTTHLHNDLWEIFDNPQDWEEQYIHPDYHQYRGSNITLADFHQPCPDVFWAPLLTPKFCKQIIEEMEFFGQWSNGKNEDPRLEGGYENVPTRDIHMRQVEWEEHWIHFLRKYIHPLQRIMYQGHDDYPYARMNFIVRYKPDEQASLRPHHDASSYTLNIALNTRGVDYEGGGVRYVRYNCSIIETRIGWGVLSPGRVTHLHEGLTTTNGTRYIFVTFINP